MKAKPPAECDVCFFIGMIWASAFSLLLWSLLLALFWAAWAALGG